MVGVVAIPNGSFNCVYTAWPWGVNRGISAYCWEDSSSEIGLAEVKVCELVSKDGEQNIRFG